MGEKLKLKVGDKVKVVKSEDFPDCVGRVCRVTAVLPPFSSFICRAYLDNWRDNTLLYDWEIEKVVIKGRQLLFEFMSQ